MTLDPETRRAVDEASKRVGKALAVALIAGMIALFAVFIWFLRLAGGLWQ